MLEAFRARCAEVMPLEFSAEPDTPRVVEEGVTLTLALPLRGNVQVRVEEVRQRRVTFATVEGHMLAGMIEFKVGGAKRDRVRFSVEIHARPATSFDWLAINTIGDAMQRSNWEQVVERIVALSGGNAPAGVQSESATLEDEEARLVERRLRQLVNRRRRVENGVPKKKAPLKAAASATSRNARAPRAQKRARKSRKARS